MRSSATRPRLRLTIGMTGSPSRPTRRTPSWATSGVSAGTLGPTVARWLREQRRALHDTIMAQATPGSIMAQGYHHAILPLASARDRRTEIRWAIRDVELRTGSRPTGLWLPEAAVDWLTLRIAAEEGIRWTILAPWQADGDVDTRVAHRVELGDDLRLVVGFYDAGLSATVSFDAASTADADGFAAGPVAHRLADGGMALICTDGELYGHHQPFRDLFLQRLLTDGAADRGIEVTTPGSWLGSLEARELPVAGIAERTSWSCHHGVARWSSECGCAADGRWKAPLRQALDRLAGAIDSLTASRLAGVGLDAWAARDRYVDVASGYRAAAALGRGRAGACRPSTGMTRPATCCWGSCRPRHHASPCSHRAAGTGRIRAGPRPPRCSGSRRTPCAWSTRHAARTWSRPSWTSSSGCASREARAASSCTPWHSTPSVNGASATGRQGRLVQRRVVRLEVALHLRDPALCDEGAMRGMSVISVEGCLVGELHREPKGMIVPGAHLDEALESLDARDGGQHQGVIEERPLGRGAGSMSESERDGVSDHAPTVAPAGVVRARHESPSG